MYYSPLLEKLLNIATNPWGLLVLGLCVGSFLNVVAYRLPLMWENMFNEEQSEKSTNISLSLPPSHCPVCSSTLKWYENIPVISWLILKGKCSNCKTSISVQYPAIECLTGLLFVLIGYITKQAPVALAWCVMASCLVAASLIDAKHLWLPDSLVYPVLWLGLGVNALEWNLAPNEAIWGAIWGYVPLWAFVKSYEALTKKEAMGHGDFKLVAALGAWFGAWMVPVMILLSFFIFLGYALISMYRAKNTDGLHTQIPMGPSICLAGLIVFVISPASIKALLGWAV